MKEFEPEQAVEAALELFWRQGYANTSMQDLVDHLGIGRGSIYDTFGSKHALWVRALTKYCDDGNRAILGLLAGTIRCCLDCASGCSPSSSTAIRN